MIEDEKKDVIEKSIKRYEEINQFSPMMQHYIETKYKYKDCILCYRLGDFFEMFFEDAIICSRELELTLTGKDCGQPEKAPMCGIPHHAIDSYIARLVEKGYKVAICEELQNSKKTIDQETGEIMDENDTTLTYILDMFGDSVEVK